MRHSNSRPLFSRCYDESRISKGKKYPKLTHVYPARGKRPRAEYSLGEERLRLLMSVKSVTKTDYDVRVYGQMSDTTALPTSAEALETQINRERKRICEQRARRGT